MCCLLDLEVEYGPVPGARGGAFAKELFAGGKTMVPYMRDPNADVAMYESDDICQYLRETYGPAQDAYDLETSDFRQCPHCGRTFNPKAWERHVPHCAKTRNRPKPPPGRRALGRGAARRTGSMNF